MTYGEYHVLALIPPASDFSLERAVAHFSGLTFSKFWSGKSIFQNEPVRAELARRFPHVEKVNENFDVRWRD